MAYAIVGWILVEVSATLLPAFEAPDWVLRVIVLFVVIGFILALVLSWAYELTPEGLKPAHGIEQSESITHITGRKLDFLIIGVLVLAVGYLLVKVYLPEGSDLKEVVQESTIDVVRVPVVREEEREVLPNSVAVLPFENLSANPEDEYFAAGIHDTILHELSKNNNLHVIARTTMLQYADGQTPIAQVAEELNVETVMEGTVQYAADQVRITTQLIDPETGAHLWSGNYDRAFADIFAIQSDIATRIAEALEAELLPDAEQDIVPRPTQSEAAYALYLKARSYVPNIAPISPPEFYVALNQATVLDPDFALAHATLAFAYGRALGYVDSQGLAGSIEAHESLIRDHAEGRAEYRSEPSAGACRSRLH